MQSAHVQALFPSLSLCYQPALHSEQSLHYKHVMCVRPCARYQRVGVGGDMMAKRGSLPSENVQQSGTSQGLRHV